MKIPLLKCPFCGKPGKQDQQEYSMLGFSDVKDVFGCEECDVWFDAPELWNRRF